jgi:hypothetical protein
LAGADVRVFIYLRCGSRIVKVWQKELFLVGAAIGIAARRGVGQINPGSRPFSKDADADQMAEGFPWQIVIFLLSFFLGGGSFVKPEVPSAPSALGITNLEWRVASWRFRPLGIVLHNKPQNASGVRESARRQVSSHKKQLIGTWEEPQQSLELRAGDRFDFADLNFSFCFLES